MGHHVVKSHTSVDRYQLNNNDFSFDNLLPFRPVHLCRAQRGPLDADVDADELRSGAAHAPRPPQEREAALPAAGGARRRGGQSPPHREEGHRRRAHGHGRLGGGDSRKFIHGTHGASLLQCNTAGNALYDEIWLKLEAI